MLACRAFLLLVTLTNMRTSHFYAVKIAMPEYLLNCENDEVMEQFVFIIYM